MWRRRGFLVLRMGDNGRGLYINTSCVVIESISDLHCEH